ncbi:MAG: hypothetical protein NTZ46_09630 [Verrucomicrobia bacterium]|nr:hypothetical protein [Verrucomicrobiota bacterium]
MDEEPSKQWRLALVLSLLALAAVTYYRFEPVRQIVDSKCPWIKEQLAQRGIEFEPTAQAASAPASAAPGTVPASRPVPAAAQNATSRAPADLNPGTAIPAKPVQAMNLAQLAANQTLWPKAVRIKKQTQFPAVLNGKEVGKLNLPAGSEVKLISITAEKVGVAYSPDGTMSNAGGAWLSIADTDLLERVHITH